MTDTSTATISGARQCIEALLSLEQSATNLPDEADDAAVFFAMQAEAAKTLADQFGPMSPGQEGASRALGEYIHFCITTGRPDLERWRPGVAETAEEFAASIEKLNRSMEEA